MKEAVFTLKLDTALRDEFMAATSALDRPASQVVRELMRDFVRRQQEARADDEFVRRKVESGRADIRSGRSSSHAEVEGRVAARRKALLSKAGDAGA